MGLLSWCALLYEAVYLDIGHLELRFRTGYCHLLSLPEAMGRWHCVSDLWRIRCDLFHQLDPTNSIQCGYVADGYRRVP